MSQTCTFATSTPKVTTEDMVGLAAPLAAETTRVSQTAPTGSLGDQSTLINLASEFKKIALCGLRWFKLNVSKCQKDVKCQMSNSQTCGLWRRFTKKIN